VSTKTLLGCTAPFTCDAAQTNHFEQNCERVRVSILEPHGAWTAAA
jgi:hypothetical protein